MRIFVSSTSNDLKSCRQVAAEVVRDSQAEAVIMEHFPADPSRIVDLCEAQLRTCQLVLLIQAHRRGWVPTPEQGGDGRTSITALELRTADRLKIPVLCFLADSNWPGRLWEDGPGDRQWVDGFRNTLNRNAKFFGWEDNPALPTFRALIGQELVNHLLRASLASDPAPSDELAVLRRLPARPLPDEPYPLLGPYEHPDTFGGRDADVDRLVALVRKQPLILCLHAASGTGKSSLLLAGLAPRLRQAGYSVSVERMPGEPRLAFRLLADLFESPSAFESEDRPLEPKAFAQWLKCARTLSGKPPVLVLDQIDDLLRASGPRERGLAQLGPLLAGTAQRLPGEQGFACKWVLCYRDEFHGSVRAWLEDVLVHARAEGLANIDSLPHDLSDAQRSHDWAVPMVGKAAPGVEGSDRSVAVFHEAIMKPLRLRGDNGQPRYGVMLDDADAYRLAACFARARVREPEAPLVPELQVVLNHLLQLGTPDTASSTALRLSVPADEALDAEVRNALTQHLRRVIESIHPIGADEAVTRAGRARTLLALRQLVDAEGRRAEGLPVAEFIRRLGSEGAALVDALSAPQARLVLVVDGRCVLSHDRLAEALTEFVQNETARGNVLLDQGLIDLQRIVAQKVALYRTDAQDESALSLKRTQRRKLEAHRDVLLFDDERRKWWMASEDWVSRIKRRWSYMIAVGVAAFATVLATLVFPPNVGHSVEVEHPLEGAQWTVRDDRAVSASSKDGVVRWTVGSPWAPHPVGAAKYEHVVVSPSALYVAGLTGNGDLHVWRAGQQPTEAAILDKVLSSEYRRLPFIFSPDGGWMMVVKRTGAVHVWPLDRPDEAKVIRFSLVLGDKADASSMSATFSSKGRWLVATGSDGDTWLMDTRRAIPARSLGKASMRPGFERPGRAFSDDESLLAWQPKTTPATIQVVQLADAATTPLELPPFRERDGQSTRKAGAGPDDYNFRLQFSRGNRFLLGRAGFQPIVSWKRNNGHFRAGIFVAGDDSHRSADRREDVRFGPSDIWAGSLSNDLRLHVWPLENPPGLGGKPVFEESYGSVGELTRPMLTFRPGGMRAAAVAPDGAVHEWELGKQPDVKRPLTHLNNGALLRYSIDGEFLYAADDRHVELGRAGERMVDVVTTLKGVQGVAVNEERSRLFVFTSDGVTVVRRAQYIWGVRLWDLSWPAMKGAMGFAEDYTDD